MGEIADDMLDGLTCQLCGQWMDDCFVNNDSEQGLNNETFDNPPGYPRTCSDCEEN